MNPREDSEMASIRVSQSLLVQGTLDSTYAYICTRTHTHTAANALLDPILFQLKCQDSHFRHQL